MSPKYSSSRNFGFGEAKPNIWLKITLYSVKFFLLISVFAPLTTNAGIFSFVSDLVSNKEADAGVLTPSLNVLGVLVANVGPSSTGGIGGGEIAIIGGSALMQESGINGTQADIQDLKSTQISLYVVRQGDSLGQIAKMYGVSVNTIIWGNSIRGPIREGDELIILPINGVSHKVLKGDTIRSIASKYKADMGDIMIYNALKSVADLVIGSTVIVPDAEPSTASPQLTARLHGAGGPLYVGYYLRPIQGGRKTQGLHGHNAVDLAAPTGTPVHAAADGVVIIARSGGYNGGYGSYIVISHPNGTQTLYGHMSVVSVAEGTYVSRGDEIGLLGSTGRSTGPHVHFEIRGAANPF